MLCVGSAAALLPLPVNSQNSTVTLLSWVPPVRPSSLSLKTQLLISRPLAPL
jgi:hypothetical protein